MMSRDLFRAILRAVTGVLNDLATAIAADPDDVEPQLVIADLLQAAGDPRGELIALDRAERDGRLDDPEALERLLLLAAEYSFPRAAPEPAMLPFVGQRSTPVRYSLEHAGRRFAIRYRKHRLVVHVPGDGVEPALQISLGLAAPNAWTAEEERTILTLLGDAIREGTPLDELRFPYATMPLPTYDGGPLRGYQLPLEFTVPRGILRNRYGLAARDVARWHDIWDRLRRTA
jgi:uncharacterized protein (TIGR02996 family)